MSVADEHVVPRAAVQAVAAITADEDVQTVSALERIVPGLAVEPVVARFAIQFVVAFTAPHAVVAAPGGQRIITAAAVEVFRFICAVLRYSLGDLRQLTSLGQGMIDGAIAATIRHGDDKRAGQCGVSHHEIIYGELGTVVRCGRYDEGDGVFSIR